MIPTARCAESLYPVFDARKQGVPDDLLGEIEVEILVRLLGYGCSARKAASYLDRPYGVVVDELKRLGLDDGCCPRQDKVPG